MGSSMSYMGPGKVAGAGELSGPLCGPSGQKGARMVKGNADSNNDRKTPSGMGKGMKKAKDNDDN